MGSMTSILESREECSQCEGTRKLFKCNICSEILCEFCMDFREVDTSWKRHYIDICKQCRPQTINKYKLERVKCSECNSNKTDRFYLSSDNKILCDSCGYQNRIIEYKKHNTENSHEPNNK
jgi:RecJ-like exonuclease